MKEMMKKWAALYVQKITEHKGKERLYWIAAGPVIVLGVFTCACILLGLVRGFLWESGGIIRFPAFASDLDGPVLALILCWYAERSSKGSSVLPQAFWFSQKAVERYLGSCW